MYYFRVAAGLTLTVLLGGCALTAEKPQTVTLQEHSAETLKLKGRIADLEERLDRSEKANASLREENAELTQRIEMLKVLDQAVEEKRKNLGSR